MRCQVWKREDWPLAKSQEGIFVQLQSLGTKRVWYLPYKDGLLRSAAHKKLIQNVALRFGLTLLYTVCVLVEARLAPTTTH